MTRTRLNPFITVSAWLLSTSVQAVTLSFSPITTVDPVIGQPFVVDLNVSGFEGDSSLGNYDLNINFQTENLGLTAEGVTFGDQLRLSGDSLQDIGVENGQVSSLAEVSLNDAAILAAQQADNFTLATLSFTPNATGDATLTISDASLGGENGELLTFTSPDAISVTVQSPAVNPALSELQRTTVVALGNVCSSLNELGSNLNADQSDLQTIACRVSVTQDARDLQNIAGEETFAPASLSIKTGTQQVKSIETHLSHRRQGANGFNTQNLKFVHNGELLSLAALGLANAIGGTAGDESGSLGLSERLGGFINATANFGELDASSREDALDFNQEEVLLGVDYRLTEQWVAGVAAGYAYYNANFQKTATVAGGSVKSDRYSGSIYSTYFIDNFYIDGLFSYTRGDNNVRRHILLQDDPVLNTVNRNRTARSTSDSDQYQASLGFGAKFYQGGISYSPYLRISYLDLTIDEYEEKGAQGLNLRVAEQNVDSLETVLGGQISYAWSHDFAVLIPHIRAEWHHEFLENERTIETEWIVAPSDPKNVDPVRSDRPDRDFASLGVGIDAVFRNSISASLTYQTVLGQQNVESHAFTAGVRMAF